MRDASHGGYVGWADEKSDDGLRGVMFEPQPPLRVSTQCPMGCDVEYGAEGPAVERLCPHMQITRSVLTLDDSER